MSERKTKTASDNERPRWPRPAPVVGLREAGTNREYRLPAVATISLGAAADCDVTIASPLISGVHCLLERDGEALRLRDHGSKNGTYLDGRKRSSGDVLDGSLLVVGTTPLFAFSEHSAVARRRLQRWLGFADTWQVAVDNALRLVTSDRPVIFVGPKGSEPHRLARVMHEAGPRGSYPFLRVTAAQLETLAAQEQTLEQAQGGAIYVGASKWPDDNALLVERLTRPTPLVRLYSGAKSRGSATYPRSPGFALDCAVVTIPPLVQRSGEIGLIVSEFAAEIASVDLNLAAEAEAVLARYAWPHEISELLEVTEAIAWAAKLGSLRKAARHLGKTHPTLSNALKRVGLDPKQVGL